MEEENFIDFSEALKALKAGKRIARAGWNGKNMFLFIMYENSIIEINDGRFVIKNYIAMLTAQETIVPWVASQSDLMFEDWFILS